ncbi:BTB/POZ domain-containing protein 6-like [Haliotis rufescens]|uniref:BTB/POZ domain-containing protein 6-like n=1 Tax=Haliotis rufescens TaxID=6454 RepID=UPI001EB06BE9|nr:BTB/POZ domain-containing protein 6-like [Haliotis rufescens]
MASKSGKATRGGSKKSKTPRKSGDDVSMWEMTIGREVDWQSGKNLPDTNLHMLVNQLNCDVTFRVGEAEEIIPAHKYMLGSRSNVFQTMFADAEAIMEDNDEIVVDDVDPNVFRHMLVFLYTDDIRLDPENVSLVLFAAKKYGIQSLRRRCLQYLEADLSPDSACVIMEQAHVYDEDDLRAKALDYILKTGDGTLRARTVGELCHECLSMVLASDDLNAPEDVVFFGALYWSECELARHEKDITPEGRRDVLGNAIYSIRFPLIDKKIFVQKVSPFGVLNDVETNTVLQYYVIPEIGAKPFITEARKGTFVRPDMYEAPKVEGPLDMTEPPEPRVELPPIIVEPEPEPKKEKKGKPKDEKTSAEKKKGKGKKKKKVTLRDHNLLRFSTRDEVLSWMCDGQMDDAIGFGCDHDFILVGFLLFGPSRYVRGQYYVRARVEDDEGNVMRGSLMEVEVDVNPNDKFYELPFPTPVRIERKRQYTLLVNVRGEPCFQGTHGNHTVILDDMTFKFFQSERSHNGTTVEMGQIPGLIVNTD